MSPEEQAAIDYAKTLETWAQIAGIHRGCSTAFLAGVKWARENPPPVVPRRARQPGYCCGEVEITEEQYDAQMSRPDHLWCCPNCGSTATFDDAAFERIHNIS